MSKPAKEDPDSGGAAPASDAKRRRVSRTRWTFDNPCAEMETNSLSGVKIGVEGSGGDGVESADLVILGVFGPDDDDHDHDLDGDGDGDEKMEDAKKGSAATAVASLEGLAKDIDDGLGGALTEVMGENAKAFGGGAKLGAMTPTLRAVVAGGEKKKGKGGTKRYVLLGLGKHPESESDDGGIGFKIGTAVASRCALEKAVKRCAVVLPFLRQSAVRDMVTALYSDLYSDNRYRTGDCVKVHAELLESVSVVAAGRESLSDSEAGGMAAAIVEGMGLARGVVMAKDIVNAPHNVLNSESLAELARKIAAESGGALGCTVLDKDQCEERGMGAFLAVARGSETQPQFIHMVYKPKEGEVRCKVGIVGKGLLFDTGGYNIKTSMMELMKFDCGGAAAVLGAARSIGEIRPPGVEAHFFVAACENMINAKAYVPSDVLTASDGTTIEVVNTDAEGRLTLADALIYADKEVGCERIIELSTLTGACMVALGKQICGVWTGDDALAGEIESASRATSDKSWRMPMATEYDEQIESNIADVKNCGTRWGGAITAALFLRRFVDKSKPFAHLDIAGPAWNDKTGATGFGAKLVVEWVRRQGREE